MRSQRLGVADVRSADLGVDGTARLRLRESRLLAVFDGGRQLELEIAELEVAARTGLLGVSTESAVLELRFAPDAVGSPARKYARRAAEAGFNDVVAALERGGGRVELAGVHKAQAAVRRWLIILLVGLCFWGVDAAIYVVTPTVVADVLAGATRVPYPYAALTALFVLGFAVAALLSLPTAAMVRAVIRQPRTASEFFDDVIYRKTGPRGAYLTALLPLGLPRPDYEGRLYTVVLGRPWWRSALLAVLMLVVLVATVEAHVAGGPVAEWVGTVGRGAIMLVALAGYLFPGAEPVAVDVRRAQRQLRWRRWCQVAMVVGFVGGLVTLAPFS